MRRGSTCNLDGAPGPQLTPCGPGRVRQALDAGQALDVRRGSTCGPGRRSRTAAHPVRTWTRSPGARRGPGARRAARLDVRTWTALPDPQLTPCGFGRVRQALDAGQALDVRRGSTCGAARRADLDGAPGPQLTRADLDAFARRSTRARRSTCGAARRATWTTLPDRSSPRADLDAFARRSTCNLDDAPGPQLTPCGRGRARQALDAGQALDVRRGSTCNLDGAPGPSAHPVRIWTRSPGAQRSPGARRAARLDVRRGSTCGPRRCSRTAAHPVRTWTRSPGARRGPGARRAARFDVRTSRAAGPQLTPVRTWTRSPGARQALDVAARLDVQPGRRSRTAAHPRADVDALGRRSTRARRSTCGAARRADRTRSRTSAHPRADLDALARRSTRAPGPRRAPAERVHVCTRVSCGPGAPSRLHVEPRRYVERLASAWRTRPRPHGGELRSGSA